MCRAIVVIQGRKEAASRTLNVLAKCINLDEAELATTTAKVPLSHSVLARYTAAQSALDVVVKQSPCL